MPQPSIEMNLVLSNPRQIYFQYYADEDYLNQWKTSWPDDVIPDREDPPFDRDAKLPQSPLEKTRISS